MGGSFGDRYGRIKTIALGASWAILGASLQTSAQNHTWMIFGKYLLNQTLISDFQSLTFLSSPNQWLGNGNLERDCSCLGNRNCRT